jgi:hypothetical protein
MWKKPAFFFGKNCQIKTGPRKHLLGQKSFYKKKKKPNKALNIWTDFDPTKLTRKQTKKQKPKARSNIKLNLTKLERLPNWIDTEPLRLLLDKIRIPKQDESH